jgi:hypothetical protein
MTDERDCRRSTLRACCPQNLNDYEAVGLSAIEVIKDFRINRPINVEHSLFARTADTKQTVLEFGTCALALLVAVVNLTSLSPRSGVHRP